MAKSKKKMDPHKIHLLGINVLNSEVNSDTSFYEGKLPTIKGHSMNLGNQMDYNVEQGRCRVRLFFEFQAVDEDDNPVNLTSKLGVEYHFHIENIEDQVTQEKEKLRINKDLPATLIAIAYSTSRGIVLERTANSLFQGIIMPVIDPYGILDK